ncbi:MAG TPA: hypothetical protein VIL69_04515 [Roseomonas sp.]|jgi:hypothetical protein
MPQRLEGAPYVFRVEAVGFGKALVKPGGVGLREVAAQSREVGDVGTVEGLIAPDARLRDAPSPERLVAEEWADRGRFSRAERGAGRSGTTGGTGHADNQLADDGAVHRILEDAGRDLVDGDLDMDVSFRWSVPSLGEDSATRARTPATRCRCAQHVGPRLS